MRPLNLISFFQLLLPVTFEKILDTIAYFVCPCRLPGATQFKVDTDLWNKETKGMLPAPNFGKYLSLDRFKRIARYLAKGPESMDDADAVKTDAWGAILVVVGWFQSD
jgi:hypothetical protein